MLSVAKRVTAMLTKHQLVRYLFSGGTAFLANLLLYIVFTRLMDKHIVLAAVLAFIGASVVAFVLQKFVTFKHTNMSALHKQYLTYVSLAGMNVVLVALGMYVLVERLQIYDIASQVLLNVIVATGNFFLYKHWLFA
jgi:putative flippase GtrA